MTKEEFNQYLDDLKLDLPDKPGGILQGKLNAITREKKDGIIITTVYARDELPGK